jgi:hypothetical protein
MCTPIPPLRRITRVLVTWESARGIGRGRSEQLNLCCISETESTDAELKG